MQAKDAVTYGVAEVQGVQAKDAGGCLICVPVLLYGLEAPQVFIVNLTAQPLQRLLVPTVVQTHTHGITCMLVCVDSRSVHVYLATGIASPSRVYACANFYHASKRSVSEALPTRCLCTRAVMHSARARRARHHPAADWC